MTQRSTDLSGLGRVASPKQVAPKKVDQAFKLIPAAPPKKLRRKTHYIRGVLDQGGTSQCVAYAGKQYATAHPVKNKLPWTEQELYDLCQAVDEWPGNDYDGTSVRALFRVLKREGYVSEYRWTWDVDTAANQILGSGPMVWGTEWFDGMFVSTEKTATNRYADFLIPDGPSAGGHAYLAIGFDMDRICYDGSKGAFTILNSWGPRWSGNGRALISARDAQKLFDLDGEACVATEILHA